MTATAAAAPPAGARTAMSRWAPWVLILALVLAVAALGGRSPSKGAALDPSSTSPQGARALNLLLGQVGAHVDLTKDPPAPGAADTALVFQDQLDQSGRGRLRAWVEAGGTLVVADSRSPLTIAAPARAGGAGGLTGLSGPVAAGCTSAAVVGIGAIDPSDALVLRSPIGGSGCFHDDVGDALMVTADVGHGTVVQLDGAALWTNAQLGKLDNSVLAVNLLAPRVGTRLVWLVRGAPGGGRKTLVQLIPTRVKEGLVQLGVALVLLGLWRGRRLGRPVLESRPVELPGSELVVAVGNLLHQGRRVDQAVAILRADLTRSLSDQLGVDPAAGPEVLADVTAARSGLDRDLVLNTLAGPPPADEAGLVVLAQAVERIRQEVARAR